MKSIRNPRNKKAPIFTRMGFDQQNVKATSNIPIGQRDYGFIRATKSTTPFPEMGSFHPTSLLTRLRSVQAKTSEHASNFRFASASSSTSSHSKRNIDQLVEPDFKCRSTKMTPFIVKRKQFDEGEFTITRGQKLSEVEPPQAAFNTSPNRDTLHKSYKEMEDFCFRMNIRIHKGFEAPL